MREVSNMANVIPNVGEIKFKLNDTATTLTCELETKFGVTVCGAYASKNFNRDINTGLAQTSALLEALENLKEHLEFHGAVEAWADDTEEYEEYEEYEDDYDFLEYDEDEEEDDYDFWDDCSDEPNGRKDAKTDLETIASVISALFDYDGSSRVKN